MNWTQQMLDQVEDMRLKGLSLTDIALEMGLTHTQVKHAVEHYHLVRIFPRECRWLELLQSDLRDDQIANLMGVKRKTVAAQRYRLKRRFRGIQPAIHHVSGRRRPW